MKFTVVAVGRLKEQFWSAACEEYLKRLKGYGGASIVEVADVDPAKCGGEEAALKREGDAILRSLGERDFVVLLDIKGTARSSESLATFIDEQALSGLSSMTFVIGGSCGVSPEVRARANATLSFGPITLPHNLARVVLLEQLYRACKISKGEPYHK